MKSINMFDSITLNGMRVFPDYGHHKACAFDVELLDEL